MQQRLCTSTVDDTRHSESGEEEKYEKVGNVQGIDTNAAYAAMTPAWDDVHSRHETATLTYMNRRTDDRNKGTLIAAQLICTNFVLLRLQ